MNSQIRDLNEKRNKFAKTNKMKEIQLTQGQVALVDDEDFEFLNKFKWHAHKIGEYYYAEAVLQMQRMVIINKGDNIDKLMVDHIDHDGLNNTKDNLRIAKREENRWNSRKRKNSASKFKGVTKKVSRNKILNKEYFNWVSSICIKSKSRHIGSFPFTEQGEIDAAISYDKEALKLFGEFANLNFK